MSKGLREPSLNNVVDFTQTVAGDDSKKRIDDQRVLMSKILIGFYTKS